jgi:hypothetical protein
MSRPAPAGVSPCWRARSLNGQTDADGFAGAGGPALRARAIAVTKAILRRSQAGPATHLSFHACQSGGDDFRAISEASGLYFLGDYGPPIAARRSEVEVFAGDGATSTSMATRCSAICWPRTSPNGWNAAA